MFSPKYYYLKVGRAADLKNQKERRIYRLLEILPGTIAWLTLLLTIFLSWLTPVFAAFFIILFDVYWLLKTIYLSLHLQSAFKKTERNLKINWLRRLDDIKNWQEFYHLILLPFYKEDGKTIRLCLEGLIKANYPKNKMIIILAAEKRAGGEAKKIAGKIQKEFQNKFFQFLITIHPENIPKEMAGKGSNIAWAGKQAKEKIIDPLKIPYNKIIVSAFDIDTIVYSNYFARLTYIYLTTKNAQNFSYQPIPFYTNNIWQAPALARIVAFSATFWHTIQQERSERITTFSSHSMSFQALLNVDFWQTNMVNEDSRIFWQCLLRHDGNYGVVPLYFPVKMDANVAPTFWRTMINLYKQQRRWAYGAENAPYFLFGFLKNKKIKLSKKWRYSWTYIEGLWSWATNALIIFLLGWLPLLLGGDAFNQTLLAYNLPQVTKWIMTLAMVGIITSAYLTILILPAKPPEYGKYKYLMMIIQWPLLFLTMIVFGAFPALEAQTRLMLGGKFRLGFWVTPKQR